MYCQKCGNEVVGVAKFCSSCGDVVQESKTPTGLIAATWALFLGSYVPLLAIPASIGMLVTAIMLIRSGNRTGKINGIIALIILGIGFMIGFVIGFSATYGK